MGRVYASNQGYTFGIDVSHHQAIDFPPWRDVARRGGFAYIRATYGTRRDRLVLGHVHRAREAGVPFGLYHFFRVVEPVDAQLEAFHAIADAVGYGMGDLVPAIDVETDMSRKPTPAWAAPAEALTIGLEKRYVGAIVYVSQREFELLGAPMWMLRRPLWVAHYTPYTPPATPAGKPYYIWQYTVSPYAPEGPWAYEPAAQDPPPLDHNRMSGPMLRIDSPDNQTTVRPSPAIPYVRELPWDEMTRERDNKVRGK